jgi:hypothetical protein
MICCAVHSAVGHCVTATCRISLLRCRTTKKTYSGTRWFERRRSHMPIYSIRAVSGTLLGCTYTGLDSRWSHPGSSRGGGSLLGKRYGCFPAISRVDGLSGPCRLYCSRRWLASSQGKLKVAGLRRTQLFDWGPVFVGLAAVNRVASIFVQPRVQEAWAPHTAILGLIAVIFFVVAGVLYARLDVSRQFVRSCLA